MPIIVMEPVRGGALAVLCTKAIEILKKENPGASIASWAIRYAASFLAVLTVLSGMSNMEHVKDNVRTIEHFKKISAHEQHVINSALKAYQFAATIPCTGCRYCMDCPKGVDIPSLFAIYNGYKSQEDSGVWINGRTPKDDFIWKYGVLGYSKSPRHCIGCNLCTRQCPQNIDIPRELAQIFALRIKFKEEREWSERKMMLHGKLAILDYPETKVTVRFSPDIWKSRKLPWKEHEEFIRVGKHLLSVIPAKGENRWLSFEAANLFEENAKYKLTMRFKVSTTKTKLTVFLGGAKGKHQVIAKPTAKGDEWTDIGVEFIPDSTAYTSICVTATDIPLFGEVICFDKIIAQKI